MAQPANLSGSQWLGNVTLTEIWLPGILGRVPRYLEGTGHAWSLAYEEQFYAVCGLLLITSRRRINLFFAGAAGVTLLTIAIAMSPAIQSRVGGLFLDGYWIMFACGIAVYYDRVYATRWQRWAVRGALGALLMIGLLQLAQSGSLFVAAAFALALIGLQRWDAAWARAQEPRFIWWCGTRCYSLYLVHWTLTRPLSRVLFELGVQSVWGTLLVTLPLCLGVSVLLGWAFHATVERRFLNRPAVLSPASVTPEPAEMLDSVPLGAGHNVLRC
jgi:peptidoglycan/LPS O-acetylase OafA/YrhL